MWVIWKWQRGSTKKPPQPTASFSSVLPASDVYRYGYYGHNLHFIVRARPNKASIRMHAKPWTCSLPKPTLLLSPCGYVRLYFAENRLFLLLRFARSRDDVLAEPAPHSKMMMTAALRHYARSLAYAGKGDRAKSLKKPSGLSRIASCNSPANNVRVANPADKVMNVAALVLEARLARPMPTAPAIPFGGLP